MKNVKKIINELSKKKRLFHFSLYFFLFSCTIEKNSIFDIKNLPEFEFADFSGSCFNFSNIKSITLSESIVPNYKLKLMGFGSINRRYFPLLLKNDQINYQHYAESVDVVKPKVKLLYIQNEETKEECLFFSLDVVGISQDMSVNFIKELNKIYNNKYTHANVVFLASHTHSGPAGLSNDSLFVPLVGDVYNIEYFNFVINIMIKLINKAKKESTHINKIGVQVTKLNKLVETRLNNMPVDNSFIKINFFDDDAKNKACIIVMSVHPVSIGANQLILSSDLVGYIEQQYRDNSFETCILWQGSVANSDALNNNGKKFSEELYKQTNNLDNTYLHNIIINYKVKKIKLPEASLNYKGCNVSDLNLFINLEILKNRPRYSKISLLQINDYYFALFPAEMSYDLSETIKIEMTKNGIDKNKIYIISLADDYLAYLLSDVYYNNASIEACSALYKADFLLPNLLF